MELIRKYFPQLTPIQIEQFTNLPGIYEYWNQRINVISRKDIANLQLHHILHSLSIAKIMPFQSGTRVLDAGTGGGFPGIPLAILFPEVHFILADSIGKKITVVKSVIEKTGLTNCEARNIRMEDLSVNVDFVVCRAVAEIPQLFKWVAGKITPGGKNPLKNGMLALKGGDLNVELATINNRKQIFNLSDYFTETFFETKKLVYIES